MVSLIAADDESVDSYTSNQGSKTSNTLTAASGNGQNSENRDGGSMLRKDSWVQSLRFLSLCVLLVVAYVVAMTVYVTLRESELKSFEAKFFDQASQVGSSIQSELDVKLQALDTLAVAISSYAGTVESGGWPNISLPEFSYRSASTLKIGTSISVGLQPLVYKEQQREWEQFSIENQGWRKEGFAFQAMFPSALTPVDKVHEEHDHDHRLMMRRMLNNTVADIPTPQNISEFIFRVADGVPTRVNDDLMMPVWQYSPIDAGLPYVNYDQYGKIRNKAALDEVVANEVAVLGPFFELSESFHG